MFIPEEAKTLGYSEELNAGCQHPILGKVGSVRSPQTAGPTVGSSCVNPELFCLVSHPSGHTASFSYSPLPILFFPLYQFLITVLQIKLPPNSLCSSGSGSPARRWDLNCPVGSFFYELQTETKMGRSSSQGWVMNAGWTQLALNTDVSWVFQEDECRLGGERTLSVR